MDALDAALREVVSSREDARGLIQILDRLRQQAEELLRNAREMGVTGIEGSSSSSSSSHNNENEQSRRENLQLMSSADPQISTDFRLLYSEEISSHLRKEEFIKDCVYLTDTSILIIYADSSYDVYDMKARQVAVRGSLSKYQNITNLRKFRLALPSAIHLLNLSSSREEATASNQDHPFTSNVIFFEPNSRDIIVFDILNRIERFRFELSGQFLEESLKFREFDDGNISIFFKRGQVGEDDLQEDTELASYFTLVKVQIYIDDSSANYSGGDFPVSSILSRTVAPPVNFAINRLQTNKIEILKDGRVILYNSFTRSMESFVYCEIVDGKVFQRKRASLNGQLVAVVEFPLSHRIGFLVNLLADAQFKFIVHDLDEKESTKQIQIDFTKITNQTITTLVFGLFEDRYLALQLQDIKLGSRNIFYDLFTQEVIAVTPGETVLAAASFEGGAANKRSAVSFITYDDQQLDIEDSTVTVYNFTHPRTPVMDILQKTGVLQQYGELAVKNIIDMLSAETSKHTPITTTNNVMEEEEEEEKGEEAVDAPPNL